MEAKSQSAEVIGTRAHPCDAGYGGTEVAPRLKMILDTVVQPDAERAKWFALHESAKLLKFHGRTVTAWRNENKAFSGVKR